ncbi:MAG: hypothetical protein Q4G52_02865, partial [Clostridia bacterium]|nr:hypothetical protein [Clostridia bacterium]
GELLEFKGKVVPEFLKVRKWFARKEKEKRILGEVAEVLNENKVFFNEIKSHYNNDNIKKRDQWMQSITQDTAENKKHWQELAEKLDKNNAITLSLLIESKRNWILGFASRVADETCKVTREEYRRFFKVYEEYEETISKNGMTNGEVDIAHRIVSESYEKHMLDHSFLEDVRGYNN